MAPVGKHAGEQVAARPRSGPVSRRLLLLATGLTLTIVAWGFLVWVAVDFGAQARAGNGPAWLFLLVATVGATGALFLARSRGHKTFLGRRGQPADPRPPRAPKGGAGKRAAR
jgi:hypothetical protein